MGGLGNQLFIYAAGRQLAVQLGAELVVDDLWYRNSDLRNFALNEFRSKFTLAEEDSTMFAWQRRKARNWISNRRLGSRAFSASKTYFEKTLGYDPHVLKLPVGSRLVGYFQSFRYFDTVASELSLEVRTLTNPSKWFLDQCDALPSNRESWTAIHVRSGDYVLANEYAKHGVLENDYYRSAFAKLGNEVSRGRLVVFSDSLDGAEPVREALGGVEVELIAPPTESTPIESLILMSRASNIVCANSTFSWWAAFIGNREGRNVVLPRRWFADSSIVSSDLRLPGWFIA